MRESRPRSLAAALRIMCVLASCATGPALAQVTTSVTVGANAPLGVIPAGAFGLNTAVWDGNLLDAAVPPALSAAGIAALRYPGGSTADIYNWQSNGIVPGQSSYANPANTFDAFMGLVGKVGATPVITVNYGSNTAGNGPGASAFAASWVQYANVTHKYGVKYWEVGNEIYGNGEYGSSWETDLHPAHDPATYGANVAQFAQAMKAVDPTIKVGAVLTAPGNWPDGQSPDWNSGVLAQCGGSIDFVIVHWYPQNPGNETDAGLLAAPQGGVNGSPGIAAMTARLRALIGQYGGANAAGVKIFVTETNSVSYDPGKQTVSLVNALFAADTMLTWVEDGAANVDLWDLHNGSSYGNASSSLYGSATYGDYGILSNATSGEPAADTPFPTYYGLQMLTLLGRAGDTLVSSASGTPLLATHAALQADGNLAVMLVNKSPTATITANVALSGFAPGSTGTVSTYGAAGGGIATTGITGLASSFSVATAPYSLTTIVFKPGSATAPAPSFGLATSGASVSVAQGGAASTQVTVAPSGGFAGSVVFAVSGLPGGVSASFSPASGATGTTLTLAASASAQTGTAALTITGTSGALGAKAALTLFVNGTAAPGFTLSSHPGSMSLTQGASAQTAIAVAPSAGFAGIVTLSASGLPGGVGAAFSPTATGSASTLTLSASAAATVGSGGVTVTGTSGALTRTVTIPLAVSAAPVDGRGPASFAGASSNNGPWFDEEDVVLSTPSPITAMVLTITASTTNVSYSGIYQTVGLQVADAHASGGTIVYTFVLGGGQTINPGQYTFAAQMQGNGTAHLVSGDTWSVTYTVGGATYTQSGQL